RGRMGERERPAGGDRAHPAHPQETGRRGPCARSHRDDLGHGIQVARLTNETRKGGRPQEEAGASARAESQRRFARLRERWRNASLKTSFMVYMLGFLVAALALSSATASLFGGL